jgi:prepilin-type N-terminal cleavage/methylation domain-containing protein
MDAKRKKSGFTLVEMLTVIGIIAILLGLLVPSLTMVRRIAKETKQKAQLTTIGLALTAFKNDYGDYPPSNGYDYAIPPAGGSLDYCGSQKLAEALLGWDLLGFHPDSQFVSDGGGVYSSDEANLRERRGPYLELATANAFRLGVTLEHDGLFADTGGLHPDRFVICDIFGVKKITLANGETVKAGTPILYYRANTSSKRMEEEEVFTGGGIYDYRDNAFLISLGKIGSGDMHELVNASVFYSADGGIVDPKASGASGISWPYRPDSYILISAGADGLYGPVYGTTGDPVYWTTDDITNFGN